jgi:hypothetical protein
MAGRDTAEQRLAYFRAGLAALAALDAPGDFAFPHLIGCGLAGGAWPEYEAALEEFAAAVGARGRRVVLYCLDGGGGSGGGGGGGGGDGDGDGVPAAVAGAGKRSAGGGGGPGGGAAAPAGKRPRPPGPARTAVASPAAGGGGPPGARAD